jgi:hypothetical protein
VIISLVHRVAQCCAVDAAIPVVVLFQPKCFGCAFYLLESGQRGEASENLARSRHSEAIWDFRFGFGLAFMKDQSEIRKSKIQIEESGNLSRSF